MSYHETSLTKVEERPMPAPASTMEERVSPMKSVDTTWSVVKLRAGSTGEGSRRYGQQLKYGQMAG